MRKRELSLNPILLLLTLFLSSIAIAYISNKHLLSVVFLGVVIVSLIVNASVTFNISKSILPFIVIYVTAASIIQYFILRTIDLEIIVMYVLKIYSIALLSLTIISRISIAELILFTSKLSLSLSITLALSIKMLKNFSRLWVFLHRLYRLNMCCRNYIDEAKNFILLIETFLMLTFYISMQSIEAFITRSKALHSPKSRNK